MFLNTPSQPQSNTLAKLTIIVLAFLGVYWIGIGLLQLCVALYTFAQSTNPDWWLYAVACWNIVISVINLLLIRQVRRRQKKAHKNVRALAYVGTTWAMIALILGAWVQVIPLFLYLALGILIWRNKSYYTELDPKEIKQLDKTTRTTQIHASALEEK